MAIVKICTYPDPVLKKKAKAVDEITPELAKLMDDMLETMYAAKGVGLAAPQVGISKRILVMDVDVSIPETEPKPGAIQIANPEIISSEGEIEWEEGCLSIPEFTLKMKRKEKIVIKGLDKNNNEMTISASGLLAVAFQHEIDHLNGKLLIDRVSSLKREMYLKKIKNMAVL